MKKLLLILLTGFVFACNNSATAPDHSLDNTDNDDTSAITDSLSTIDSLQGR